MMTMMIKFKYVLATLLMFLLFSNNSSAKTSYPKEDRKAWGSMGIKYQLNDLISFELSQELRYYKERTLLEQSVTDFGSTVKILDWLKIGLFYRYKSYPDVTDADDAKYSNEIYTNISVKQDLYGFEITNRIRLQAKFKGNNEDSYYFRNKLELEYEDMLEWAKPFASAELFCELANGADNHITQARYSLGISFIPIKNNEISIFFLRENEHNKRKIINSNIIGFGYQLEL